MSQLQHAVSHSLLHPVENINCQFVIRKCANSVVITLRIWAKLLLIITKLAWNKAEALPVIVSY